MATTLIIIAATSVVLYVVSTILIYDYLRKSGEKVSFLWIRLFMIKNASRYKKLTREKTGLRFYIWVVSINLTLICFILLVSKFPNL